MKDVTGIKTLFTYQIMIHGNRVHFLRLLIYCISQCHFQVLEN